MTDYGRISNKTSSIINPAEAIAANYTYAPRVHVSQAAQKATDATEKATDAVNDKKNPPQLMAPGSNNFVYIPKKALDAQVAQSAAHGILPSLYNNSTYISEEELAARAADAKRTTETKNFAQKRYEFRTVIDHMYTKAAEQTQQKPKGVAESAKNKAYEHDWEKKMRVWSISKGMNSASSEESEEESAPSEESEEEKKKDTGSTTLNAIKSVVALAVLAILAAKYNKMRSGRRGGDGLPKVSRKKR